VVRPLMSVHLARGGAPGTLHAAHAHAPRTTSRRATAVPQLPHNERHPVRAVSTAKLIHSCDRAETVDPAGLAQREQARS